MTKDCTCPLDKRVQDLSGQDREADRDNVIGTCSFLFRASGMQRHHLKETINRNRKLEISRAQSEMVLQKCPDPIRIDYI